MSFIPGDARLGAESSAVALCGAGFRKCGDLFESLVRSALRSLDVRRHRHRAGNGGPGFAVEPAPMALAEPGAGMSDTSLAGRSIGR